MPWLNKLKIAVIEENIENINALTTTIPNFDSLDKAQEALSLLQTAISLVKREQHKIALNMDKIRKTKEYLKN
ncbi:hypothetical protein [Sulfurospirillum sp. 1612]|uniref:hypothetical protein n=1 Tax=Sulfurospirillum sp. 1612 TaxID=3094835 RepID=UPI002F92F028